MKKGIAEKRKTEALQALVIQLDRIEAKLDKVLGAKPAKVETVKNTGTGAKTGAGGKKTATAEAPAAPPVVDGGQPAGTPEVKPE